MSARFRVALQGFGEIERNTLAQCLRLPPGRIPAYDQVGELALSDFVVADCDAADAADLVARLTEAGRLEDTVFVGAAPVPGAISRVRPPIDPRLIVRELDALAALRGPREAGAPATAQTNARAQSAPAAGSRPEAQIETLADDAKAPASAQLRQPAPPAAAHDEKARARAKARAAAARRRSDAQPADPGDATRDVLVLDDSDIAAHYLASMLEELGLHAHLATTSAEALALLTRQPFAIALLDIVLGEDDELDGLDICQRIKHEPLALAGSAPIVVLISGQAQASDRVRATLAGSDAFLTKPFAQKDLVRALESCGLTLLPTLTAPIGDRPPV